MENVSKFVENGEKWSKFICAVKARGKIEKTKQDADY